MSKVVLRSREQRISTCHRIEQASKHACTAASLAFHLLAVRTRAVLSFGVVPAAEILHRQSLHKNSLRGISIVAKNKTMMQADDAVHPALAECTSLDSVELFDVDLDGGSSNVSAANTSLPSPTSTSSAAHRSTSSPPPVPPMTGTITSICAEEPPKRSQHEQLQYDTTSSSSGRAPIANEDEAKTTEKHVRHIRKLSAYNLISPAPALGKVPSSDSATVTTASSGSISTSSSSSMLSAMDNYYEEDVMSSRSMDKKVKESESNDRGVYHFKVSKVKSQTEIRPSAGVSALSVEDINTQSGKSRGEDAPGGEEIMSAEATRINEASQITTVSTMPGPHDNNERAENDQRGVYRFKVQVDEAQLRRAEWWKLW